MSSRLVPRAAAKGAFDRKSADATALSLLRTASVAIPRLRDALGDAADADGDRPREQAARLAEGCKLLSQHWERQWGTADAVAAGGPLARVRGRAAVEGTLRVGARMPAAVRSPAPDTPEYAALLRALPRNVPVAASAVCHELTVPARQPSSFDAIDSAESRAFCRRHIRVLVLDSWDPLRFGDAALMATQYNFSAVIVARHVSSTAQMQTPVGLATQASQQREWAHEEAAALGSRALEDSEGLIDALSVYRTDQVGKTLRRLEQLGYGVVALNQEYQGDKAATGYGDISPAAHHAARRATARSVVFVSSDTFLTEKCSKIIRSGLPCKLPEHTFAHLALDSIYPSKSQ